MVPSKTRDTRADEARRAPRKQYWTTWGLLGRAIRATGSGVDRAGAVRPGACAPEPHDNALRVSKRRLGPAARWDAAVRVLRRIPLDRRKHLYLVQVTDRVLLIGAGESGPPSLIADLDPEALERASRAAFNDSYG